MHDMLKAEESADLQLENGGVFERFDEGSKIYNTSSTNCNCNYRFQFGSVCKHTIFYRKANNLPIFDKNCFSSVYFDDFMLAGEDDDDVESHFQQLEYFECSKPPKQANHQSNSSRFRELHEVTNSIAELAAAAPASLHSSYLSFLKQLSDVVRAGKPLCPSILYDENCSPSGNDTDENCPPSENIDNEPSLPSDNDDDDVAENFIPFEPEYFFTNRQEDVVKNKEMLDDFCIDSFVVHLKKSVSFQFQSVGRSQTFFESVDHTTPNFQIIHLQSRTHYILTRQLPDETIEVYDSLNCESLNEETSRLMHMLYPKFSKIVKCNAQRQEGGVDCGLFALANLTMLANGRDPTTVAFNQSKLRDHFMRCMKKKKISYFPATKRVGAPRKRPLELLNICETFKSVNDCELRFLKGHESKGRPRKEKQRRYEPSYNKK